MLTEKNASKIINYEDELGGLFEFLCLVDNLRLNTIHDILRSHNRESMLYSLAILESDLIARCFVL